MELETTQSAVPVFIPRRVDIVPLKRAEVEPSKNALSPREWEVMLAIATGESPSVTAKRLGIDIKTVSTYRYRVFQKTGARTNVQLAVSAYAQGIIS